MKEEEMELYTVRGLGLSTGVAENNGYVVFMKRRAGNAAFYTWVLTKYVESAFKQVDNAFPEVKDSPAFLKIDDEPIRMRGCVEASESKGTDRIMMEF